MIQRSDRMELVHSDIRGELFRRSLKMQQEGINVLKLNTGNPATFGFTMADSIRNALEGNEHKAVGYCDFQGMPAAREAIAAYHRSKGIDGVEAGDVFIGNGVRTTPQGIDFMIDRFRKSVPYGRYNVIGQQLPSEPESFIHLDMVFTMLDTDKCMVFKPLIMQANQYQTVHIVIQDGIVTSIRPVSGLLSVLKKLGMDPKPIVCGGADEWDQEREQWHSGANFFAFAPGKVLSYARNIHTLEELSKNGFEVVSANEFISGRADGAVYGDSPCVVTIDGSELPRGGGGATDIALTSSDMNFSNGVTSRSSASLKSRIIVAGGGAGASARYTVTETTGTTNSLLATLSSHTSTGAGSTTYPYWTRYALNSHINQSGTYSVNWDSTTGGTFSRVLYVIYNLSPWTIEKETVISKGGTFKIDLDTYPESAYSHNIFIYAAKGSSEPCYLSGGKLYIQEATTSSSSSKSTATTSKQGGGVSGKGQYPGTQTAAGQGGAFGVGGSVSVTNYRYSGGGGGGGWYGGGTGHSDTSTSYINYCGGGSGFVNTAANASARPSDYTGLELDSGTTIAGNSSFESPSGGTETGHSGNGYARITRIN